MMSSVTPQSDQQGDDGAAMLPKQATTYADARAIRSAVLATLTTRERSLLWRWCIGITMVYAALAALLAIFLL
jgi:hypothetical protein